MNKKRIIQTKLRFAVLGLIGAALAAGAAQANAATVVAYWDFEKVEADGISIKAAVGPYTGTIMDAAVLTPSGGGHKDKGKGFDVSPANKGYMFLEAEGAANPMNIVADADAGTIVVWQKNNANISSSTFWAVNSAGGGRGWQFHIPWSDGTIYFDTTGCCTAPTQRLNRNVVATFPDFDWNAWHHYAFVKNAGYKAVYIDGQLLMEQAEGADPLTSDFTQLFIGAASDRNSPDGVIDDFAIYKGALTEAEIKDLAAGRTTPGVAPTDADSDGMPNDWETQYGLNPNDASDAAKDLNVNGFTNLEEFNLGLDPTDTTKPTVVSAVGTSTFKQVVITFSKALGPKGDLSTATNLANYSLSPSLAITAASVKGKVVTLTTAAQTPGATAYTVTINNVKDVNNWTVAANTTAKFYSYINTKTGLLKFSYWGNITGTPVQGLYDDPRYPASPDLVSAVYRFSSRDAFPDDSHENYGATMEGFLTPTEAGNYRFFVYSDDASELYLSTDDKEANLALIAQETGCCNNFTEPDSPRTSEPIALVAGKKYFIRMVYKEGGGGDYGQVAWRKEGDTTAAGSLPVIPGKYLSSAVDMPAPAEGVFVTQSPAPKATGVSPTPIITIAHIDGAVAWTAQNVTLKFDDVDVTAKSTITKEATELKIVYTPSAMLANGSHKIALGYLDPGSNPATMEWSFTVIPYSTGPKDKVASYPALLLGKAAYTADKGGRSGAAGDYGMDMTTKGGPVTVIDPAFLTAINAASAKDELSVSFWQKKYDIADSSAINFYSPSQGRIFHAHVPWSDNQIYFDTTGCCDASTQRIQAMADTFSGWTGDWAGNRDITWWTSSWHLFVITKKADQKNVYIDGELFLNGSSSGVMANNGNQFNIGGESWTGGLNHAIYDDVAIYSKELTQANVTALKGGTKPTALTAAGPIAYWDFNEGAAAPAPTLSLTRDGAAITITFTGTLQSSSSITGGTWTDVQGTSPLTVTPTSTTFYRARN